MKKEKRKNEKGKWGFGPDFSNLGKWFPYFTIYSGLGLLGYYLKPGLGPNGLVPSIGLNFQI